MATELWLFRHGETEWSKSGAHTGRTDIPLTEEGRKRAAALKPWLGGRKFSLVLTSPLSRARETCDIAGFCDIAEVEPNLVEWNYGDYEGRTTADIRKERPGWFLWGDGVPNGETVDQVAARARAVIDRSAQIDGAVALFAHGHVLRVLTACWLNLPADTGRLFSLGTASVSTLGYERQTRVIATWNITPCDHTGL